VRLEFGSQLLIDLDFYCVPKNADFCETVWVHRGEVPLTDIPVGMQLQTKKYLLIGVIHRRSNYFIAFTRNASGCWRLCDDLKKKPVSIDQRKTRWEEDKSVSSCTRLHSTVGNINVQDL
jgi:hypothetical protein